MTAPEPDLSRPMKRCGGTTAQPPKPYRRTTIISAAPTSNPSRFLATCCRGYACESAEPPRAGCVRRPLLGRRLGANAANSTELAEVPLQVPPRAGAKSGFSNPLKTIACTRRCRQSRMQPLQAALADTLQLGVESDREMQAHDRQEERGKGEEVNCPLRPLLTASRVSLRQPEQQTGGEQGLSSRSHCRMRHASFGFRNLNDRPPIRPFPAIDRASPGIALAHQNAGRKQSDCQRHRCAQHQP